MRILELLNYNDGVLTVGVDGFPVEHPLPMLAGKNDISVQDFSIQLKSYYKIEIKHPQIYVWGGEIIDLTPNLPKFALFPNEEGAEFSWSDGLASRSRRPMLLIFCRNHIFEFTGKDIPGICVVKTRSHSGGGKWSSTTYDLMIAKGFNASSLRQDFDTGHFVNDVTSLAKIAKELGCEGVQPYAVEEFLKTNLFGTYKRYIEYLNKVSEMEAFEETEGGEFIPYTFVRECLANRQGYRCLLLNGELFEGVETPEVRIISQKYYSGMRGGKTVYEMSIHSSVETEELFEYNPYGGDESLTTRGFTLINGKWVKPQAGVADNPFASLNGLFK